MGTVVALASQGGVAIAGDRRAVDERTVTSRRVQRVAETNTVGAGVVGETGDVQTFRRELEGELRPVRIEHDGEVGIDRLARIATRVADRSNVAAVIEGRDSDGIARLREVRPDGRVFDRTAVALGDGANSDPGSGYRIADRSKGVIPRVLPSEAVGVVRDMVSDMTRRKFVRKTHPEVTTAYHSPVNGRTSGRRTGNKQAAPAGRCRLLELSIPPPGRLKAPIDAGTMTT